MAFSATLDLVDGIAKIILVGELDASTASVFKEEVEKAAVPGLKHLVLLLKDLEYVASAGLRVLVFAKQKMGSAVDLYVIGAQESILETLTKTGLDHSLIIQDEYLG
jgi:anti-anti-sigma factor